MPNQASTAEAAFVGQQSAAGGRVRILRIDRPAARNALNAAILTALAARFRRADADDEVRAIVLTGGEEVFSAGADIDALSGHSPSSYLELPNRAAFDAIRDTRKPVVAAVAGYCLGGGCETALGCDFVVAADNAVFGQPEINLGIIPGAGGRSSGSAAPAPGCKRSPRCAARRSTPSLRASTAWRTPLYRPAPWSPPASRSPRNSWKRPRSPCAPPRPRCAPSGRPHFTDRSATKRR